MATTGGEECRLCRYGGGLCQPGFRKVHVRGDPQCRLHGVTQRMTSRLVQPYTPPQQTPPVSTAAPSTGTPLDQKTAFRTKGGLHLLFEPDAMDAWIARSIATNEEGDYVDAQTRETLGAVEKADYVRYRRRLGEKTPRGETSGPLGPHSGQVPPAGGGGEQGLCHEVPSKRWGACLRKLGHYAKDCRPKRCTRKGRWRRKKSGEVQNRL